MATDGVLRAPYGATRQKTMNDTTLGSHRTSMSGAKVRLITAIVESSDLIMGGLVRHTVALVPDRVVMS